MNIPNKSFRWLFAELIVVVLGIMLAFQVEEFRSYLNERQEEQISLKAIVRDLDLGESEFELWEGALQANMEYLENLVGYVSDPLQRNGEALDELIGTGLRGRYWAPTSPAFSGMRDSGKLAIISDADLQRSIVAYFDIGEPFVLERRIELQEIVARFQVALYQDTRTVPSPNFKQSQTFQRTLAVPPMEFPTHPDFMRLLSRVYSNTQSTIGIIENFKMRISQLRGDIVAHLGTLE